MSGKSVNYNDRDQFSWTSVCIASLNFYLEFDRLGRPSTEYVIDLSIMEGAIRIRRRYQHLECMSRG